MLSTFAASVPCTVTPPPVTAEPLMAVVARKRVPQSTPARGPVKNAYPVVGGAGRQRGRLRRHGGQGGRDGSHRGEDDGKAAHGSPGRSLKVIGGEHSRTPCIRP